MEVDSTVCVDGELYTLPARKRLTVRVAEEKFRLYVLT